MLLTITMEENVFQIDVAGEMEIQNVMAYCEAESNVPFSNLVLIHDGTPLVDLSKTLIDYKVKDGDMLLVVPRTSVRPVRRPSSDTTGPTLIDDPANSISKSQAAEIRQALRDDPRELQNVAENNPEMARLVTEGSIEDFYKCFQKELVRQHRMRAADPSDIEAQKWIEERMYREQIDKNMEQAIEHLPESFAQVHMCYLNVKVNGTSVYAFVDTGAQTTIISKPCAEKCGLSRLIDSRYAGFATGVGTQAIEGKVHMVQIQIGDDYLPCSLTVLDSQPMDILLGLDMLRRHQCVIDLKNDEILIGTTGQKVKFLPEAEARHISNLNLPSTSKIKKN